MNITPGTLLNNRYRIMAVLGQGGMGAVYKALDENLGIPVAVKENLFLTEEYSRQFQREANILASLRHPSLPRVRDYFTLPGVGQYLVMDFIEGEDLRQRIERISNLPEEEVVLIGAHICDALTHLHNRTPPVIHRDIKPGNIKVTPDGHVVLVDFGLAKEMVQDNQVTTTGARAMTPGYSPPEQYGTARTDARSDVYSLGATLYAALTGVIPEDSLSRATGKINLTSIRQLRPKINRKLASVIEQALEVDPDDRYQTAEEFKKELLESCNLTQVFQEPKTVAPPPETGEWELEGAVSPGKMPNAADLRPPTASRPRRRRKTNYLPIALFAAVLLGAAGIAALNRLPGLFAAQPPTRIATLPAEPAQTEPPAVAATRPPTSAALQLPTEAVQPSALAVAPPDGTVTATVPAEPTPIGGGFSEIAFASNRSGSFQIWTMNADSTNQIQMTNIPGGACQPAWSSDGSQLAFTSPCSGRKDSYPGSSIYIMNADGTDPHLLPVPPSPNGDYDPAWSPDGQKIAFTSLRNGRSHIFVYNFQTALLSEVSTTVFPDKQPSWSPSGKQIAFIRQNPNGQVWWMGDDGSQPAQFSPSGGINNLWPVWSRDGQIIYYSQTSVDVVQPWLIALRYEDRNTGRELRIPANSNISIGPVARPDVSPDGKWLAFESWPLGNNHDIYLMTSSGTNLTRLTTDQAFDFGPTWRPVKTR